MSSLPREMNGKIMDIQFKQKKHSLSPQPRILPKADFPSIPSTYGKIQVVCIRKVSSKERLRMKILESQQRQCFKVNWNAINAN